MPQWRLELAGIVPQQARAPLSAEDRGRLPAARPPNPEAHDLYLRGRRHYHKWSVPEFEKAANCFHLATALDPNHAQAYLGLAKTLGWQWTLGVWPPKESFPKFTAALQEALAMDGSIPEAHHVQAFAAWYFYCNWAAAEKNSRTRCD